MRDTAGSDAGEVLIHFPALDSVVPPGSAIHSAELVVYLSVSRPMLRLQMGSSGAARAWSESTVLWGTKPAAAGKPAMKSYNAGMGMADTPVRVDVTSLVRLWAGGEIGERTVILSPGSADMDVSFYSREGAKPDLQPQLVIRCSPVQTSVPLDSGPRDAMQMKGLNRLVMNSVITPTIVLDAGAVRFAHLDLAIPNFGIQEAVQFNQATQDVFPGCPAVRDGYIHLSDKPGWGVDLDEEQAKKFPLPEQPGYWLPVRRRDGTAVKP
jgi:hypothetical protein